MSNSKRSPDELQHSRIVKILELLKKGRAGLNEDGRIVDLSKRPRASKISASPMRASKILMTVDNMHLAR